MPIKFDFYAFFMIEETTGRGVPSLLGEIEAAAIDPTSKRLFSPLTRLYWAGRLHEKPNFTLRDACAEIQDRIGKSEELGKIAEQVLSEVMKSGLLGRDESDPKQESPAQ